MINNNVEIICLVLRYLIFRIRFYLLFECEQAGIVKKDHIKIHGFWAVGVLSVKFYLPDYVLGIIYNLSRVDVIVVFLMCSYVLPCDVGLWISEHCVLFALKTYMKTV